MPRVDGRGTAAAVGVGAATGRDLRALPKAHLHLHFTGALRPTTLRALADKHGIRLPRALTEGTPPELRATDERGWFRFQRLYDLARQVVRDTDDVRRLVVEAARDDAAEGSGWLEIQVDPSGYAAWLGGLTRTLETVLEAARQATEDTGVGVAVVVGANRTKHPLEARTLARLAARYADAGVVGFGLANDERRGRTEDFERAFAIARRAGLLAVPHAGELAGAANVRAALDRLGARRIGHGVRAVEDPALLEELAATGTTLEVCPGSNVALGVAERPRDVPLRTLLAAGVPVALGADDPLLFGSRLVDQYTVARTAHGLDDASLAQLARSSVLGSAAPEPVKARLLAGIEAWLKLPAAAVASPAIRRPAVGPASPASSPRAPARPAD